MPNKLVNGLPIGDDGRVKVIAALPDADDSIWLQGKRFRESDQTLYVVANNAPATYVAGLGFNALHQLCMTEAIEIPTSYVGPIPLDNADQVMVSGTLPINCYANGWPFFNGLAPAPESLLVPFSDLGDGVVDINPTITSGTVAFARASPAYTNLADGTLKQVGANVPRSYYWLGSGVHPGPELVKNGTFAAGTADWVVDAGASFSVVAGVAELATGTGSNRAVTQPIATIEKGKSYRCSMNVIACSAQCALRIDGIVVTPGGYSGELGVRSGVWVSTKSSPAYVELVADDGSRTFSVDDVSIVELLPDASYGGYFCERPATNLCTESSNFGAWANGDVTLNPNAGPAPDPTQPATLVTATAATAALGYAITLTAATQHAVSCYCKAGNVPSLLMGVWDNVGAAWVAYGTFNLLTGSHLLEYGTLASVEQLADGWWRATITFTTASSGGHAFHMYPRREGNNVPEAGDTMYVWGAQIEQDNFSSSYIATAGATVTRAGDRLTYGKENIDATVGTAYMELRNIDPNATYSPPSYLVIDSGSGAGPLFAFGAQKIFLNDGTTNPATVGWDMTEFSVPIASTWGGANASTVGGNGALMTIAFDGGFNSGTWLGGIAIGGVGDSANCDGTIRNLHIWKSKVTGPQLKAMTQESAPTYTFLCVSPQAVELHPIAFSDGFSHAFY